MKNTNFQIEGWAVVGGLYNVLVKTELVDQSFSCIFNSQSTPIIGMYSGKCLVMKSGFAKSGLAFVVVPLMGKGKKGRHNFRLKL